MESRRALNSTDESGYSVGSEVRRAAAVAQQFLASKDLELLAPELVIQRSLSMKSVILTTSSFARRFQQAHDRPDLQLFVEIGKGMQGVVFEKVRLFLRTSLDVQVLILYG
jgi:hypothetical protein